MADKTTETKKVEDFEILQEDDEFEEFEDGLSFVLLSHPSYRSLLLDWTAQDEEVENSLWVTDWDDEGLEDDFGKQLRYALASLIWK